MELPHQLHHDQHHQSNTRGGHSLRTLSLSRGSVVKQLTQSSLLRGRYELTEQLSHLLAVVCVR